MDTIQMNLEILNKVEASLDTMRPYLVRDGGNVEVVELTADMLLKVRLVGACETCPQSYMTMKAGIENAVMNAVPGILGIIAVS